MAKKSKNMLYVGIGVGVLLILFLIIGFSTNWFQSKKNTDKNNNESSGDSNLQRNNMDSGIDSGIDSDIDSGIDSGIDSDIDSDIDSGTDSGMDRYAQSMLQYHNSVRSKCNAKGKTPSLKWNSQLAKKSKQYAEKLVKTNNCQMSHHKHGASNNKDSYDDLNAGENLARFQRIYSNPSHAPSAKELVKIASKDAVNGWAGEGYGKDAAGLTNPKFRKPGSNKPMTGHYGAMNWKDSSELGCGSAVGANNCIITACHYAKKPANAIMVGQQKSDYINCTEPIKI